MRHTHNPLGASVAVHALDVSHIGHVPILASSNARETASKFNAWVWEAARIETYVSGLGAVTSSSGVVSVQ